MCAEARPKEAIMQYRPGELTSSRDRVGWNVSLTIRVVVLASAVLGALVITGDTTPASAKSDVTVTELDCNGSPELVVLTNQGADPQDLTGWKLESDPPADESLDLVPLAIIWPDQSVMIESGPRAEAAFTWARKFVFRNDDPTDYVQIRDDANNVVQKVSCGAQPTATAEPTTVPTPTALPATATPSVDDVPSGGGLPGSAGGGGLSPTFVTVLGASLTTGGLVLLSTTALLAMPSRSRRRAKLPAIVIPDPSPTVVRRGSQQDATSNTQLLMGAIAALTVLATLLLLFGSEGKRR